MARPEGMHGGHEATRMGRVYSSFLTNAM
jgi:hypothetical protein